MKIIKTNFFTKQVNQLVKKYPKISEDLLIFENNFDLESFSDLGSGIYKYRLKNSSIPVGKRGGFRIIVKIYCNKVIPLLIYAKTIKENVNDKEIIYA